MASVNTISWHYTFKIVSVVQKRGSNPNYGGIFLAGCVGGTVQLAIACPVELIKGGNHYYLTIDATADQFYIALTNDPHTLGISFSCLQHIFLFQLHHISF
jgi:hypothetical protein